MLFLSLSLFLCLYFTLTPFLGIILGLNHMRKGTKLVCFMHDSRQSNCIVEKRRRINIDTENKIPDPEAITQGLSLPTLFRYVIS